MFSAPAGGRNDCPRINIWIGFSEDHHRKTYVVREKILSSLLTGAKLSRLLPDFRSAIDPHVWTGVHIINQFRGFWPQKTTVQSMIASFSVRDLHRLPAFQDSALHLLSPVSVRAENPLFLK